MEVSRLSVVVIATCFFLLYNDGWMEETKVTIDSVVLGIL